MKHITYLSCIFLLYSIQLRSQLSEFPDFNDYSKVGFSIRPVLYSKAIIKNNYGDYKLTSQKTPSINFGFDYLIHPERAWAYKTGLHLDIVPLFNYNFTIREGDVSPEYNNNEVVVKMSPKLNFTVPALVQFKKQMAYNLYFNLETGLNIMLMEKGTIESSNTFISEGSKEQTIFAIHADTKSPLVVYPNVIISPGFYFAFNGILIQGNVIYQKPLIAFFEGEYAFDNLKVSQPTKGTYKINGEYLGLQFSVHLKRNKKNRQLLRTI